MREFFLILAMSSLRVFAQTEILAPPEELDQAVRQGLLHVPTPVATSSAPADRIVIEAEYSEEARIAGLEGTVRLWVEIAKDGTASDVVVTQRLGLGLDESSVNVGRQWRQMESGPSKVDLYVDFVLPEQRSRWHLVDVVFYTPNGAQRPRFASTTYPTGTGLVGEAIMDHAQVIAALDRRAWASIAFDIDERGKPVRFSLENATLDVWAEQAIEIIRAWRFEPALMDGKPITAHCIVVLTWGARNLDVAGLARIRVQLERERYVQSISETRSKRTP